MACEGPAELQPSYWSSDVAAVDAVGGAEASLDTADHVSGPGIRLHTAQEDLVSDMVRQLVAVEEGIASSID